MLNPQKQTAPESLAAQGAVRQRKLQITSGRGAVSVGNSREIVAQPSERTRCPQCGSARIISEGMSDEVGETEYRTRCMQCDWEQLYDSARPAFFKPARTTGIIVPFTRPPHTVANCDCDLPCF